jgi:hypothetical protein
MGCGRRKKDEMNDLLRYYATPESITTPGAHADRLDGLPTEIGALARVVQGVMVHAFWAERYGLHLPPERESEAQLRCVERMLARIAELDGRPLAEPRDLEHKLVGNCRDHSTLLCAMLRHQGIPARARCGFGAYFIPGHYEDHWVCEYWHAAQARWVLVDAQLDALQQQTLGITFDPLDVPRDQFIVAGQAWQMCRQQGADPAAFGIMDMHGLWFILGNLFRDLWALQKVELLPWDGWWDQVDNVEPGPADLTRGDLLAPLTLPPDAHFAEIGAACRHDERLRLPADWRP